MEDERLSRSSTRNSQVKRVGAEGQRDNVKKHQNERQAVSGLLHPFEFMLRIKKPFNDLGHIINIDGDPISPHRIRYV